jgi:hypothetical protein
VKEYHKIRTYYERAGKPYKVTPKRQVLTEEFTVINRWVIDEKVDGTNTRFIFDGEKVTWAGRTARAQFGKELSAFLDGVAEHMSQLGWNTPLIIFGETVGPKINGNPYGLDEFQFFGFDVWISRLTPPSALSVPNWDWGYWLNRSALTAFLAGAQIERVPYLCDMQYKNAELVMNEARSRLPGNKTDYFEGIIGRPAVELVSQRGRRVIWKLKRKDF